MNKSLLASLHFLGVSHHGQSQQVRGQYALGDEEHGELLSSFSASGKFQGILVISTCNRTEVIFDGGSQALALQILTDYFQTGSGTISGHFVALDGWQVVRHLFRLTSGLDSMVMGDIQIASQIKESIRRSTDAGQLSPLLSKLCQSSFKAGKRVRAETGISNGAASVAYTALLMAKEYFGTLRDCSALVVGTGDMGRDVVYNLMSKGLNRLTVMNRTESTGRAYAELIDGHFMPISELPGEIDKHDIIITCTAAGKILIDENMVPDSDAKQLFLDLSMPANIGAAVHERKNVVRVDIDTIQNHLDKSMVARTGEVPQAEAIISEEMLAFQYRQILDMASPSIVQLREEYELIRQEELARAVEDMDPALLPVLEQLSQRLVKRLAVMPIEILCGQAEKSTLAMEEYLDASLN